MTSFILGAQIGTGSFGSVYRVQREGLPCAAKECFASYADLSDATVKKEIEILQQLRQRYIIQYLETVDHNGHLYILMDLAEKGSLAGAIARGEVTDWETKNRIAHEVARGLEYIHRYDILHRDLKTANVLLTRFMEVKLCDFGLAKVKTLSASASTDGFKGTLRWAAPETLELRPNYSTKSDVYALGMVMWAMVANKPEPFSDQHDNMVIAAHIKNGRREEIPDDTPSEYRMWIERCWHQDPLQRPRASEVILVEDAVKVPLFENSKSFVSLSSSMYESIRNRLADCGYDKGKGVEQSSPEAIKWYRKAAEEGSAEAQFCLGLMRSAEQGESGAQINLGMMYEFGLGVEQSCTEAVEWYRKAAEQGDAKAEYYLGIAYELGQGIEEDLVEAASWYRKSAEHGNPDGQRSLGLMYDDGRGVERNDTEAVAWYRRAAEQGNAKAQYRLAILYEIGGEGVEQDEVEAVSWYRKAAEQGDVRAMNFLGIAYEDGLGVEQDFVKATSWHRQAAERGSIESQYSLGSMYGHGRGVEKNEAMAATWYRMAAIQGHSEAQRSLDSMYDDDRELSRTV
ncbi:copper transport protein ctr1 [Actinomortierella wolfii]|nr:copper transport protein ctr1 [Actinomortierella wolfii]